MTTDVPSFEAGDACKVGATGGVPGGLSVGEIGSYFLQPGH